MTTLPDSSVLIALTIEEHVHHEAAERWFVSSGEPFALCPITEGSLVRQLMREGQSARCARAVLDGFAIHPRHEFWPDALTYREVLFAGVVGHRQVTDAYLARLARAHRGRLATFNRGLAHLHTDVAELVPTEPPGPPRPRDPD